MIRYEDGFIEMNGEFRELMNDWFMITKHLYGCLCNMMPDTEVPAVPDMLSAGLAAAISCAQSEGIENFEIESKPVDDAETFDFLANVTFGDDDEDNDSDDMSPESNREY